MSTLPSYELQLRAADERRRLESSMSELKSRVREKLDVKRNLRRHFWMASGIAATLALIVGYGITGMWTRRQS